jgi:tripartite-type tricarboxylate transporter receptor subunit TctC
MKLNDRARRLCCGLAASLAAPLAVGTASAENVEEFYRGKIITVTWAGEEGGSYDAYARLLSKHMRRSIPGNPNMVMRYMPGGGGLRYANYVPVSEPADGLYIGIMNYSTFPYRYLFPEQAKFNPDTFSHIGSMAVVNTVISALRDKTDEKGVKTVQDVESNEIVMAATGRGSQSYQDVAIVNKLIGTKFKLISGYPGAAQAVLAVERGEVDGFAITWDGWVTRRPQWLAENKLLHFVQFGQPEIAGLDDVPLVNSLAKNDVDRAAVGRTLHRRHRASAPSLSSCSALAACSGSHPQHRYEEGRSD